MEEKKSFFKRYPSFCIFAVLAVLIILMAILAPQLSGGVSPTKGSLAEAIQAPSADHPFGTDKMGRDIFVRVLYGARTSLSSTFILVAVIFVIGTILGILAGYFGGAVDAVIMRIADMMIAFPGLVLAIAVAGILVASMRNAIIAIAVVSWPKYARLARSLVMKIRHTDIGGMMMELAALSFLGFGAQPPTPEWGQMLNEGRNFMQSAPWLMIYPGLAIFVTVVVFNMLGDGLRDILDPRNE